MNGSSGFKGVYYSLKRRVNGAQNAYMDQGWSWWTGDLDLIARFRRCVLEGRLDLASLIWTERLTTVCFISYLL